tara:strand:- start:699 stop:1568 length:870 start_codon:yes stop_codon:yes gene_type:complete
LTEYLFLIPVYNDWQSLNLLVKKIDKELGIRSRSGTILVVNDCSTIEQEINFKSLENIKKYKLLNLNRNLGSQKSIAVGLKYLESKKLNSVITIMDSDGEDDPLKINEMIDEAEKNKNFIITSNRTNRKENFLFKWLYIVHKFSTFVFSGHWISFGNFSSFNSKNLSNILRDNKVWLAYSSAVSKNCKIKRLYAKRKDRYFGKSKVNFLSLVLHSLRVISVLQLNVILFSLIYLLIFLSLFLIYDRVYFLIVFFLIIIFNLKLQIIKAAINTKNLDSWKNYIKEIKTII